MEPRASFTSVRFRNFKALGDYSVSLQRLNLLTGPNNCGKSTIIGAFRALEVALRRARARNPTLLEGPKSGEYIYGHSIGQTLLPISVANVHTNYSEDDSLVTFRISNGNKLHLFFPEAGGCIFFGETSSGKAVKTTTAFKLAFPISLKIVPLLGPVENEEKILEKETILNDLGTHRASRHFRNFWYHFPEGFDDFAQRVSATWPTMGIKRPERKDVMSDQLVMYCTEERIDRELFWSGYGFQIWCQLLTHIASSSETTLLVIDEPEIYLHPDVQRQLISILKGQGPDILVATHSSEILSEADPGDILVIDKSRKSAERLHNIAGVQQALDKIGSLQNLTLTQLAKNKCLLFVEGASDLRLLKRFAAKLSLHNLTVGSSITIVPTGSFSTWKEILHFASTSHKAVGTAFRIGVVFDRDFFPKEEINKIEEELNEHLDFVAFHSYKEIENYLLVPAALERAIAKQIVEKRNRGDLPASISPPTNCLELLEGITTKTRIETQSQLITRREKYLRNVLRDSRDPATINAESLELFEREWLKIDRRFRIVPGKEVLRAFREQIQEKFKVTITDGMIVDAITVDEMPSELVQLVRDLDKFCQRKDKK